MSTGDGLTADRGVYAAACGGCSARPFCGGLQPELLALPGSEEELAPFEAPLEVLLATALAERPLDVERGGDLPLGSWWLGAEGLGPTGTRRPW